MSGGKRFGGLQYYIGTSGWHYDHWRYLFYPDKLPKAKWLEFYSRHFTTVELNNSFYRLPSEEAFANWRDSSPANFTFAVKVSRFITHIKRLRGIEQPLDILLGRAKILKDKLGPLLYQLPPNMHRNDDRLESFLSLLPQKHNAGLCVFDMPGLSCPLVATANFTYVRFHGSTGLYSSCYSDDELADWARRLAGLAPEVREVYIYFNNDAEAFAVKNARTLRDYVEREAGEV